ncbi:MAG: 4Fe-4S binding protein [Fusobacteriaceae bacterium]|jgi:pyruvate ferredoxin oxidoreductase delta subunit|nr:4Fe-4S binding protein [Fusobacteriaceae bacterium]
MRNKDGKKIDETILWKEITPGGLTYEGGSAKHFKTGDWRSEKPIFIKEACKQCLLCVPVCPDSSIPVVNGERLEFDYDHCKGCGICVEACPFDAIKMEIE